MAYYIMLENGKTIDLPTELSLEERIDLCERIINEYPLYFTQHIAGSNCSEQVAYKTELRLEIMANYILNAEKERVQGSVISRYKEKRIRKSEAIFSELEYKYNYD